MGSWAAIAKIDAPEPVGPVHRSEASDISVAVVDTNAIISGLQFDRIADTAVTIPEVFSEIRDKQARQTLATLPFPLESQEPSEDSVKAVLRFARATGDLHSLSTADIKLIALARTLELARHGDSALRTLPETSAVHKGTGPADRQLPGWDSKGGTWTDMDKLAEEEILEAELKLAGILSKVSQAVQSLNISTESQQATDEQSEASTVAESQHTSAQLKSPESQSAEQQPDSNDADDWQKASSSHNAARKKKRKQQRRAAWTNKAEEQATPSSPLAPATPARPQPGGSAARDASAAQAQGSLPPSGAVTSATASTENIHASSQPSQATEQVFWNSSAEGIVRSEQSLSQPQVALKGENDAAEPEQASHAEQAHPNMATCSAHLDSETASDSASDDSADDQDQLSSHADSDEDASGSGDEEGQTEEASPSQSSVASVTADFAMQNVILQMGLRLVAPNGMRIRKLTRWVLRCSACFKITKEPGRLFCPHCGNATLDKVELTIAPDGTEQYGVRKRFNTRGTRFSLPKPKGGYQKNAPILREDVLMQKLNKRRNRKPKEEAVDAFAPEYGPDSWFQKNHGSAAQYKGAAAALASWRHNPNERKHSRSNRRKK